MAVDTSRLAALVDVVQRPWCDAFHVRQHDHVLIDVATERGQAPLETMSVTKAVVSMVVGRLVTQGLLDTVDRPLANFFPEWRATPKEAITVRHVLEHTSGLAAQRTTEEIYASSDLVRLALDAELATVPGTRFFYNNKAVNLLGAVVLEVSGRRLDHYAAEELFEPLGIDDWGWTLDHAGNPHCMAGLQLQARDLATLGQLMLQEGSWEDVQLLTLEWVAASTSPSAVMGSRGFLWSLAGDQHVVIDDGVIEVWRQADPPVEEAFIAKVLPLKDRPMPRPDFFACLRAAFGSGSHEPAEWHINTWQRGLPDGKLIVNPVTAFHDGYRGQYLIVIPDEGIVAAHLRVRDAPFQGAQGLISILKDLCET